MTNKEALSILRIAEEDMRCENIPIIPLATYGVAINALYKIDQMKSELEKELPECEVALQNLIEAIEMLNKHTDDGSFSHPSWSISKLFGLITILKIWTNVQ